jgi:Tfp pilus assembly protein FimT
MAILVTVAAVAAPIFWQSFEIERLRKGADTLRTAWAKARVHAMTTGQTHVFQFEYGASAYIVSIWDAGDSETEASTTTPVSERPGQLPDGIVFHAAEKVSDARSADADAAGAQTAPLILFYSDGTTSTAQVMISNSQDRFIKVYLRGLTGVPQVGEVVSAEELELEQ